MSAISSWDSDLCSYSTADTVACGMGSRDNSCLLTVWEQQQQSEYKQCRQTTRLWRKALPCELASCVWLNQNSLSLTHYLICFCLPVCLPITPSVYILLSASHWVSLSLSFLVSLVVTAFPLQNLVSCFLVWQESSRFIRSSKGKKIISHMWLLWDLISFYSVDFSATRQSCLLISTLIYHCP